MNGILLVFLGGGLGCVLRFLIGKFSNLYLSNSLPIGTFLANLLSCVLVALVLILLKSKQEVQVETLKLFLLVGFCGGLSTFSTFSLESIELIRNHSYLAAFLNIAFSLLFGFGAMFALLSKSN